MRWRPTAKVNSATFDNSADNEARVKAPPDEAQAQKPAEEPTVTLGSVAQANKTVSDYPFVLLWANGSFSRPKPTKGTIVLLRLVRKLT